MANNIESLDTNILLRLFLADIPSEYEKAKTLISKTDRDFDVADLAITEMVYVLEKQKRLPRRKIVEAVTKIMSWPNISCNRPLFEIVLPFYLEHPAVSFNDCCLAAYAQIKQREPLWTFDRKLAMQSGVAKELK
jgi:predicted nucleic acid-binding protein